MEPGPKWFCIRSHMLYIGYSEKTYQHFFVSSSLDIWYLASPRYFTNFIPLMVLWAKRPHPRDHVFYNVVYSREFEVLRTRGRLAPVIKTIFHQCVISYTCSQSYSDGSVLRTLKQSHQS